LRANDLRLIGCNFVPVQGRGAGETVWLEVLCKLDLAGYVTGQRDFRLRQSEQLLDLAWEEGVTDNVGSRKSTEQSTATMAWSWLPAVIREYINNLLIRHRLWAHKCLLVSWLQGIERGQEV
jgi:hypothetical protein